MPQPRQPVATTSQLLAAVVLAALGAGVGGYTVAPSSSAAPASIECASCEETKDEVSRTMAGYDASLDDLVKRVAYTEQLIVAGCPRPDPPDPARQSLSSSSGVGK